MRPVSARREGTGRRADGVVEEGVGLADEGQQFGQQHGRVAALKDVDVAGADALEIGHSHLALVGAALGEEHLAGAEAIGEGRPLGHQPPATDAQIARRDVLDADVTLDAGRGRVGGAVGVEADDVAEGDAGPGLWLTHGAYAVLRSRIQIRG